MFSAARNSRIEGVPAEGGHPAGMGGPDREEGRVPRQHGEAPHQVAGLGWGAQKTDIKHKKKTLNTKKNKNSKGDYYNQKRNT